MLRVLDVEVGKEHHFEPPAQLRIVVDHGSHRMDELDDELGHDITRRGLGREDERAGGQIGLRVAFEAQIEREDVQDVEVLALVFVQALGLDVEQRIRVDHDAGALRDERREVALGGKFHLPPLLLELRIVRQRFESAELPEVAQPALAEVPADEPGKRRIAHRDEAARGDAVGDVAEFFRPQPGEIAHHRLLEQFRVEACDPIDVMTADGGEMGHADKAPVVLVNE